jgi:hypothetical protein
MDEASRALTRLRVDPSIRVHHYSHVTSVDESRPRGGSDGLRFQPTWLIFSEEPEAAFII